MSLKELEPSETGRILKQGLSEKNVYFVFPTDVAATSWAEWCILNPGLSGVKTVGLDRFIAWDTFKGQFISSKVEGKKTIPSLLRKFFIQDLLNKNAEEAEKGKPLFSRIISEKYAKDGSSFTDWLSGNLPGLKLWYDHFQEWKKNNPGQEDDEDRDYLKLYELYNSFLGDRFFEPGWINPDFSGSDRHFIVFYPEQLEDFFEYKEILAGNDSITAYILPEKQKNPQKVITFPDSRKELRYAALYIRHLVLEKKVPWEQIAVHVPDFDTIRPYLKREFTKYCIPFVIRSGLKYTQNSAGSIFSDINEVHNSNFSYDSVRTLLTNGYVPWLHYERNESLVRIGKDLHCICNYEGSAGDVWTTALNGTGRNELDYRYYKTLHSAVEGICLAPDFKTLKDKWIAFRIQLLAEKFPEEFQISDAILGRSISELDALIALESDFIKPLGLKVSSPFSFFLNELSHKIYNPQTEKSGVNVFDYKLAAGSAWKYNLILNASQKSLTFSYKPVSFLNNTKREKLGFRDSDQASLAFIRLYGKFNSENEETTLFSSSEDSFQGFSIPHSALKPVELKDSGLDFLEKTDFINAEKHFMSGESGELPFISEAQKAQFESWKQRSDFTKLSSDESAGEAVKKAVDFVLRENRNKKSEDKTKLKISQSDMKHFFPCPRQWLFSQVLRLKEDSLDAELFDNFAQGTINHKILELSFNELKILPFFHEDSGDFGEKEAEVRSTVEKAFDEAVKDPDYSGSPLVSDVLEGQKDGFVKEIMEFLYVFCTRFGGWKVCDTEKSVETILPEKNYGLYGKIDCVLADDSGNIAVIDYKNSTIPSVKSCIVSDDGSIGDFQCPMYVTIWKKAEKGELNRMEFWSIKDKKNAKVISEEEKKGKCAFIKPEDYEKTLDAFKNYTDAFAEKIDSLAFNPDLKGKDPWNQFNVYTNCTQCKFKTVCRTTFTVGKHELKGDAE